MNLFNRILSTLRKLVLGVALVGLVGGAAWGIWHWHSTGESGVRYRTEKVTRGRVAALINASGTVVPEEVIDVGAQVGGKIVEFGPDLDNPTRRIDYRSRVEKDTVLARIDDSLYRPEVSIARAELAVAEAEILRSQADVEACRAKANQASRDLTRARRGGTSVSALELDSLTALAETNRAAVPAAEAALEKARKSVQRAQAVLEKAEQNLRYTVIRSPVRGVIVDRRVNIGQTVVASLNAPSLFLLATDLRKMQVWASVNEADIGRIHVGQSACFRVDAFPEEVFSGSVAQIRLNASMAQNVVTYTVVVDTDNSNLKLLPYLTANLQFRVDHHDDVLIIPNAALRFRPAPERVAPVHLREYLESRKRKNSPAELKPGTHRPDTLGTVWLEDEAGFVRPIKVRLGLTDGTVTEVAEVLEHDIEVGDQLVVGEVQEQAATTSNPFAVKMWGKKKE